MGETTRVPCTDELPYVVKKEVSRRSAAVPEPLPRWLPGELVRICMMNSMKVMQRRVQANVREVFPILINEKNPSLML